MGHWINAPPFKSSPRRQPGGQCKLDKRSPTGPAPSPKNASPSAFRRSTWSCAIPHQAVGPSFTTPADGTKANSRFPWGLKSVAWRFCLTRTQRGPASLFAIPFQSPCAERPWGRRPDAHFLLCVPVVVVGQPIDRSINDPLIMVCNRSVSGIPLWNDLR